MLTLAAIPATTALDATSLGTKDQESDTHSLGLATPSDRPSISVVLAAHNGERFLVEQLASILPQLDPRDELLISVDPSQDRTLALAQEWAATATKAKPDESPHVLVLKGPGRGIVANFQRALQACSKELVFLSDQDDVWLEGKITRMLTAFAQSGALLVCHDALVVDERLNLIEPSYFARHKSRGGFFYTILRNSYCGCCLAFKRDLLQTALPFPPGIPMHDQWLGLIAEQQGACLFLDEPLILYRRHDSTNTASHHAGIRQMIAWRLALLRALRKTGHS